LIGHPFGITQRPVSRLVIRRTSAMDCSCLTQSAAYWIRGLSVVLLSRFTEVSPRVLQSAFDQEPTFIQDGMGDGHDMGIDAFQVTQYVEMQRTGPQAFRAAVP